MYQQRVYDLVFKNCQIVNVYTGEITAGDVAVNDDKIMGIGSYKGTRELDMAGKYLIPGLIDAHMHLESTMVHPSEFSRLVSPMGTTTAIVDPHEIANVCGIEGIRYLMDESADLDIDVLFMMPSCVPATSFDDSGARIEALDMKELLDDERMIGLGEMMDFRGVIDDNYTVMEKISLFKGRMIDGHAPEISGNELNAYISKGIRTDHECGTREEMREKLRLGLYVLIREGSAAQNLKELIFEVNDKNIRRCMFCTDDRNLVDITAAGHIDNCVRMAIETGMDPIKAITMATLNAAECYGLRDRGAIAPGLIADIVILDDLCDFKIASVYKKGRLVDRNASFKKLSKNMGLNSENKLLNTVHIKKTTDNSFSSKHTSLNPEELVIQILPGTILTSAKKRSDFNNDELNKIAVAERHKATGAVGVGWLAGLGLKDGAIAITVSHDSHNMVIAGDNDNDMRLAMNELENKNGGITIVSGGKVLKTLQLELAGLISLKPYEEVREDLAALSGIARRLGISEGVDPFMTLSFLSLTVIPELRLTDKGLFHVNQNKYI